MHTSFPFGSRFVGWMTIVLLCGLSLPATGQPSTENGTVTVGGGSHLHIGGLFQTDAYLNRPPSDGFRIRTTRLRLGGRAETLQYVIHTDFAASSVLLDAFARFPLHERLRVTAGLFKAPFGAEFLTSRPDILFAERSRAANQIPPGRQAGISLSAEMVPDRLSATLGAFNGTRGLQQNDNDHLLYAGRLENTTSLGSMTLKTAFNAGYSVDDAVARPGLAPSGSFSGTRFLFGGDARLSGDRWHFEGELNAVRLDPDGSSGTQTARGYYLAGAFDVTERHQLLTRFDQYDPDVPNQSSPDDQVTLGYNVNPTSMLRVLFNYQASVNDLGDGFVTARLQVALR